MRKRQKDTGCYLSLNVTTLIRYKGVLDIHRLNTYRPVDVTMSLDKAIKHGKEHRKPYTGSKAIDCTCRNHGSCPWCEENRKHKFRDKHQIEKDGED